MASPTNASFPPEQKVQQGETASMESGMVKSEQGQPGSENVKSGSAVHAKKRSGCLDDDGAGHSPSKIAKREMKEQIISQEATEGMKTTVSITQSRIAQATLASKKRTADTSSAVSCSPKRLKTEAEEAGKGVGRKKHVKKRMKFLLQAVLDLMEFYFGDSNLSKDRYLKEMIDASPDGYVDVSVFGNFNKLQSLHKDGVSARVIVKAVRKSKMLQVNEDETKIHRITPVIKISQEDMDNRTVYVENLPSHANHAWVKTVFSQCGRVMYVSLPTYKNTRNIKGFAFVEFDTSDEAGKACTMLNNPPPAKTEEKAGKFPRGNKTLNRLQRLVSPRVEQDSNEENISDDQKADAVPPTGTQGSKKKKKKKSKKKKPQESMEDAGSTTAIGDSTLTVTDTDSMTVKEQTEGVKKEQQPEGKKKKKKKKRKQNHASEKLSGQEVEKSNDVENVIPAATACTAMDTQDMPQALDTGKGEEIGGRVAEEKEGEEVGARRKERSEGGEMEEVGGQQVGENESSSKTEMVGVKKKRKKHKKQRAERKSQGEGIMGVSHQNMQERISENDNIQKMETCAQITSRKARKLARQEDIRRKKLERARLAEGEARSGGDEKFSRESREEDKVLGGEESAVRRRGGLGSDSLLSSEVTDSETEDTTKGSRKSDGSELTSILKSKKGQERKKVEFDPVPVTTEFVKGREIRKRKKPKRDKLQLRVIAKKEWLSLKAEYIAQQKSHMAALKESLRELRQQENQGRREKAGSRHMDLEDVFGTKRLKPSRDVKMAHVESLKFTPNVIVQWKCSHEMHRDKIRTLFKEMAGDSIAYIDAKEEAKSGYIRFKDEASAEKFTKLSRRSSSFMTRVLPAEQQQAYWDKANEDRMKKLGQKKHEKGSEKIARKVFERNKATFHQKPSRIVFDDESDENDDGNNKETDMKLEVGKEERMNQTGQKRDQNGQEGDQAVTSVD